MLKEKDAVISKIMVVFDIGIISAAFIISYYLRMHIHSLYKFDIFPSKNIISHPNPHFSDYLLVLFIVALLWCFFMQKNGMYGSWRIRKVWPVIWTIFKSSIFTLVIVGAAFFLFKITFISRIFFIIFAILGSFLLIFEKLIFFSLIQRIQKRGHHYRQVLIVGTGRRAEEFIKRIKGHPEWGLKIIGAIEDEPGRGIKKVDDVDVIGDLTKIPDILHQQTIDEIIIIVPRLRLHQLEKAIYEFEIEGVKVTVAVDLFDLKIARSYQTELDGIPLLTFKTTVPSEGQLFIKRTMDIMISGLCILFLTPLLLIIAVFIKLTSPGPIFFKQERVGLNKRRFVMYKFRTMSIGAQKDLLKVDIYKEIYEPEWKNKKLKYVTPIGKILRKYSLDEWPQLFNVLLGHMSLVGPRPTLPQEVEQYQTWYRRRFSMRPGITCLWQVSGRRAVQLNEWMQLDLEYLDHWSLWLDIRILIKTIPAVFFGHGAY